MNETTLKRCVAALSGKQAAMNRRFAYYDGTAMLPVITERLREVYHQFNVVGAENWSAVVVDSMTDRITLRGLHGLRGVGVTVVQIGSQTCGKPYGFYPEDNCGTTYFSIQFKGVNALGFGDYTDGFVPQNATAQNGGVPLPGCSVADDFGHALGDPAEARLAAALSYIQSGSCPSPSGLGAPGTVSMQAHVMKPVWLMNRILRRPR